MKVVDGGMIGGIKVQLAVDPHPHIDPLHAELGALRSEVAATVERLPVGNAAADSEITALRASLKEFRLRLSTVDTGIAKLLEDNPIQLSNYRQAQVEALPQLRSAVESQIAALERAVTICADSAQARTDAETSRRNYRVAVIALFATIVSVAVAVLALF